MRKFVAFAALSMLVAACGDKGDAAAPGAETPAGEQSADAGASGDFREHRPGLWENVIDDGSSVSTIRECSAGQVGQAASLLDEPAKDGCTKTQRAVRGGVNVKMVCPSEVVSEVELSMTGSATEKQIQTTLTVNGEKVTSKASARWIGPCPDGMQPGDVVQDGE